MYKKKYIYMYLYVESSNERLTAIMVIKKYLWRQVDTCANCVVYSKKYSEYNIICVFFKLTQIKERKINVEIT